MNASDPVLVELDGMIEATEEFIRDDGLRSDDARIHDLSALLHVRLLYTEVFAPAPVVTEVGICRTLTNNQLERGERCGCDACNATQPPEEPS